MAALLGVMGILPAAGTLNDADTYWHLAAGRWIIENRSIPQVDPFSHSMPGAPWHAHEWLSEVLMATAHAAAGWAGLVTVTALAFAVTLAYLMRFLLLRMEPIHALLLVSLTAAMMMGHLLARPHAWIWPLLALWVGTLVAASESQRRPPWWLLILIVVWANMHASFFLGLGLAFAIGLDATWTQQRSERLRTAGTWLAFAAAATAASLCTPQGWHGLVYPLRVTSMGLTLEVLVEWASPNFHRLLVLEVWLLLFFGLALIGRLRLPWLRVLIVLALLHLTLKHARNTALLGLISAFIVARPWATHWYASAPPASDAQTLDRVFRSLALPASKLAWLLAGGVAIASVVTLAKVRPFEPKADKTPARALQAALAEHPQGPVLNHYGFGGYLIYQGVPVFVDGRADMYGDAFMARYMAALQLADPTSVTTLLQRHAIGWTILQPGTPLVTHLEGMPGWRRAYADAVAVVHIRTPESARPAGAPSRP